MNSVMNNDTLMNINSSMTMNLTRRSPSDEYFKYYVLDMQEEHNVENIGHIQPKLCLCLILAWTLVVIFVSKGIHSTGKVYII